MAETISWSLAGGGKPRIATIHQVFSEHGSKVIEVLDGKLQKGKPGGPHVRHCILRMPGVLDVSSRSFVGQYRDFGEQTSGAPEMMCGRYW